MHPLFHRIQDAFHRHPHHHLGRHGHRGFAGFAGFAGRHGLSGDPSGAGFDGLGRGRKLASADLQLLLLALLAERPSHGYELIKALDERSRGYYAPSPGMVYPALTYLEETGLASVEVQGTRKLYRISDAGLGHLESQRPSVDALLEQLAYIGQRMEAMRRAMGARDTADDADDLDAPQAAAGRGRHAGGDPTMRSARHKLKSALIEKSGATAAEQRRIAAILERAAAEIRDGGVDQ